MKRFCLALVLPIFIGPALAQDQEVEATTPSIFFDAGGIDSGLDISEFQWINRLVVVFSDSPADPRFVQQMEMLEARPDELAERDVIVLSDSNPAAESALRTKYRPRGFMMVLVGKDGTVYLRKPLPWDVREISRSIDKLPTRQQEIRDRRLTQ
ncbi:DUF4174 domain-containing protein [Cognatishimia maritima]|uniref:DUF4174 domain-containing protein n=1 Tax=Cognatishimia maritima TaxID=870908 RepID=A0A1M5JRI1_9RHOB|nr:DUF4174 domain-containing protein [Cognatishimia maritima]SHG43167.1 protein of unknown function [Cognatishimia maritima]